MQFRGMMRGELLRFARRGLSNVLKESESGEFHQTVCVCVRVRVCVCVCVCVWRACGVCVCGDVICEVWAVE